MSNFLATEIAGARKEVINKIVRIFKMQKASWKFKCEKEVRKDTILAFVKSK